MPAVSRSRIAILAGHALASRPTASGAQPASALEKGTVVAITGAAGYVGGWITRVCLDRGYSVRACVRSLDDSHKIGFLRAMPEYGERLTLLVADMTVKGSYDDIFEGCTVVFHPAEVFMSFAPGRNPDSAMKTFEKSSGKFDGANSLNRAALAGGQFIVDSINKSSTVKRLIYTSSIAALIGGPVGGTREDEPIVDETHEPPPSEPPSGYGNTKRLLEKYFDFEAKASGGKWDVFIGNPGDVIGPILSPHQATENWQGVIGGVVQGIPPPQQVKSRPFLLVDVRDVALAEVLLAESSTVPSGSRFLLSSGDKLPLPDIGVRAMELHPEWDCPTHVVPPPGADKLVPYWTFYYRTHLNNSKVRNAIGMRFRSFDDTFQATVDSLVAVGGIKPRMKLP